MTPMYKKIFFLFFLFCRVGECGELILFLACDTEARNIESGVYHDLENIRKEALRISNYTGLPIKEISFIGKELQPESVLNACCSLEVEVDDLLFFYFSGHGFRTVAKGDDPWPNLFFSSSRQGIDYGEVIAILSQKHPRLLIAIADCCNNVMKENAAPHVYWNGSVKSKKEHVSKAYQKLFLETEGKILVTSSEIGEFSWSVCEGALFTLAFLESLKMEAEKGSGDWGKILKRSSWKVRKYQHPYYEISPS